MSWSGSAATSAARRRWSGRCPIDRARRCAAPTSRQPTCAPAGGRRSISTAASSKRSTGTARIAGAATEMGLPRGSIRLLIDEAKRRPFSGSVLELGRMSVFATDAQLSRWAREQGVELAPLERVELSHDPRLAALGCMSDVSFFRRLGFDDVVTLDYSDWEKPDLVWDLNQPVPTDWHGRYDCVLESGTIQHVFHLPNVLLNMHDLLAPGGRVVHGQAPSHNHVDHGFVMFSPT